MSVSHCYFSFISLYPGVLGYDVQREALKCLLRELIVLNGIPVGHLDMFNGKNNNVGLVGSFYSLKFDLVSPCISTHHTGINLFLSLLISTPSELE